VETIRSLSDDWGAICTSHFVIHGNWVWVYTPSFLDRSFRGLLLGCGLAPGATLLTRRICFDLIGFFDETLPRHQDWDWLIRLSQSYRIAVLETPLAKVCVGESPRAQIVEISKRRFLAKHDANLRVFGSDYYRKAIGAHWLELARLLFQEKQFARGCGYCIKGLLQNPIQWPGVYTSIIDALLGTPLTPWLSQYRRRILNR